MCYGWRQFILIDQKNKHLNWSHFEVFEISIWLFAWFSWLKVLVRLRLIILQNSLEFHASTIKFNTRLIILKVPENKFLILICWYLHVSFCHWYLILQFSWYLQRLYCNVLKCDTNYIVRFHDTTKMNEISFTYQETNNFHIRSVNSNLKQSKSTFLNIHDKF